MEKPKIKEFEVFSGITTSPMATIEIKEDSIEFPLLVAKKEVDNFDVKTETSMDDSFREKSFNGSSQSLSRKRRTRQSTLQESFENGDDERISWSPGTQQCPPYSRAKKSLFTLDGSNEGLISSARTKVRQIFIFAYFFICLC